MSRKIIAWFGFLFGERVQVTEVHQGKVNLEEANLQLMEEIDEYRYHDNHLDEK